jgi:predicted glycoside hydrolase/deacetylase ChbG (UPF0249 family)
MKALTHCADDFGYSDSVNQGILNLVKLGKLDAVSCLTNFPLWSQAAKALRDISDNDCSIGLHLNFTEGHALTKAAQAYFGPLSTVIRRAFLRRFPPSILKAEIKAQIDAFTHAMGRLPSHIDGHQHIHHLPQICDALLAVYDEYYPQKNAWIRVSGNPRWRDNLHPLKALIIAGTGAMHLRKRLQQKGIPHNTSFAGIYSFDAAADYAKLFEGFLKRSQKAGLIMCHPGLPSEDIGDEIYKTRGLEYQFLASLNITTNSSKGSRSRPGK